MFLYFRLVFELYEIWLEVELARSQQRRLDARDRALDRTAVKNVGDDRPDNGGYVASEWLRVGQPGESTLNLDFVCIEIFLSDTQLWVVDLPLGNVRQGHIDDADRSSQYGTKRIRHSPVGQVHVITLGGTVSILMLVVKCDE